MVHPSDLQKVVASLREPFAERGVTFGTLDGDLALFSTGTSVKVEFPPFPSYLQILEALGVALGKLPIYCADLPELDAEGSPPATVLAVCGDAP